MRLIPIPPATMSPELRVMHDEIRAAMNEHLSGFTSQLKDGSNIPFSPMLHYPVFGSPLWSLIKALINNSSLPKSAREVAILVSATKFNSRYELYSHEVVASQAGLSSTQIAAITCGQRPNDLSPVENLVYEITHHLANGGQLSNSAYDQAVTVLGKEQAAELIYLIATYCLISVVLNAFDITVPES